MSENNIEDILEIRETPQPHTGNIQNNESSIAEKTLCKVAKIQLWIGLVVAFICLIIVFTDEGRRNESVGVTCLIGTFVISFASLSVWALLRVIANISTTLKEIRDNIGK